MDLLFSLVCGLLLGSFVNVCSYRIPLGESIVTPRSHCRACSRSITWYDNVPLFSYFLLAAKCRYCAGTISARYPTVEAMTAIISLALAWQYGLTMHWGIYLLFCGGLLVLSCIDLDHRLLPDVITITGIGLGILANLYLRPPNLFADQLSRLIGLHGENTYVLSFLSSLAGVIFCGGLMWIVRETFYRIRGIEGLGLGDVKMVAMIGAFLGVPLTLLTILVGSVSGSIVGLLLINVFGKDRSYHMPFGTFLAFGALIATLFGYRVIPIYLTSWRLFPY